MHERVERLRASGHSIRAIASKLAISKSVVALAVKGIA
jgi:transposase